MLFSRDFDEQDKYLFNLFRKMMNGIPVEKLKTLEYRL